MTTAVGSGADGKRGQGQEGEQQGCGSLYHVSGISCKEWLQQLQSC